MTSTSTSSLDRRRPKRGDERRAALLQALDVLLEGGASLDSINIADLSRRAGVTRSAFYFYFENKALAAAALMQEFYADAAGYADVLVAGPGRPEQRIRTVISGLLDAVDRHLPAYRAMLEARANNQTVRELWDADRASFVEPVASMIRAERRAGRAPRGVSEEALATLLLELNDRAMEHHARGDSGLDRQQRLDALVTIWVRSIHGTAARAGARRNR